MNARLFLAPIALGFALATPARSDEKLKDIACRSVHLQYPAAKGVAFYNEMTVEESAPGTYFMACGWDKGYFGIQEQGRGKKVAIFSVWDSGNNDPNATAADDRVKLLYKDDAVRTGRFGGEGSGGQSFMDLDWKVGDTYRFLVTATPNEKRTEYTGYLRGPKDAEWKRLVTFSTVTGGKPLSGYYSFVEDFKRDRESTTKVRKASYGNGWVRTTENTWVPLDRARFTADSNPATNIDAGSNSGRYFLITGGKTENAGTKLRAEIPLPARKDPHPPADLPIPAKK